MQRPKKLKFYNFIEHFPEVKLPVTLGEEAIHAFSEKNTPLSDEIIQQFIQPLEKVEIDEFTEYIACFKIPETHDFHAVIYWRATLMNYQYFLITFDKKGELIDQRVIAGTFSDGSQITTSVATIDPDWSIYIVTGITNVNRKEYDAATSKAYELELLSDGLIVEPI